MLQKTTRHFIQLCYFVVLSFGLGFSLPSMSQGMQNTPPPQKRIMPPDVPPSLPRPPFPIPPIMTVAKADQAIQLQSLHIQTQIAGSMGESTIKMVFYNPNNRALEGNLEFPLQDGQSITGFSLDINGKQRDAVPVEKARGRQVFEEIQRRGIDPALLEVTQGNHFKLRIFPLPAKGSRTVELHLAHALQNQHGQWQLPLSLASFKDAKSSLIEVKVTGNSAPAIASMGAKTWSFTPLKSESSAQQWQLKDEDFNANSMLSIRIPETKVAQQFTQEFQGNTYFYTEVNIDNHLKQRSLPKVIGLLWDSSSSGKNRDIPAELNELSLIFKAMSNTVNQVEVRFTRLRDRPEATRIFKVKNGQWEDLRKEISSTIYDGASALTDWKVESQVEEYWLFSDGLRNYGKNIYPSVNKNQRVFTFNSGSGGNSASLSALAQQNGGHYIHIQAENAGQATQQLLNEGTRVIDASGNQISAIQFESTNPSGNILRISGILNTPQSTLNLRLSQQGQIINLPINIRSDAPSHPLVAHLWARYRLQNLEGMPELYRAEIRRIGQQFSIPTSETSLIVLEMAADYARYQITPPEELRKEVEELLSQSNMHIKKQTQQKIDSIAKQFQEKITWWKKDFTAQINAYQQSRKASKAALEMQVNAMQDRSSEPMQERAVSMAMPAPAPASIAPQGADMLRARSSARNEESMVKKENSSSSSSSSLSITMKKWTSDAPYIRRMKAASKETIYAIYLDEKESYQNSSAFFLDAADMLLEKGERALALRVVSNLAEMELENRSILRILAYRLMEMNAPELALAIFEKITHLAEEEPQSFRDYGLALAANKQYQAAIEQLYQVVQGKWDGRFVDIELISLAEMNAVIATAQSQSIQLNVSQIDSRLLHNLPLDIRVVMTWDADNSDMDLWVTDPLGEKCYFGHNATAQGGRMTRDATQGYGPEEFSLRKALPGKYKIEANFYGNRQQMIAGATTLQVKLMTHFGTNKAQEKILTLRLKEAGSTVFAGEFEVK